MIMVPLRMIHATLDTFRKRKKNLVREPKKDGMRVECEKYRSKGEIIRDIYPVIASSPIENILKQFKHLRQSVLRTCYITFVERVNLQ